MSHPIGAPSPAWLAWRRQTDLDEYESRWDALAADGQAVHGEADLVCSWAPGRVLDAGCGMGRVAVELDRRGIEVVGVDLDEDLLARARARAPHLRWVRADLAALDLGRTFDVVLLAGNVLPFVAPDRRPAAVAGCARHLAPGGRLVSGSSLREGWPQVGELEGWCRDAGLQPQARLADWGGREWTPDRDYLVSVSRARPPAAPPR